MTRRDSLQCIHEPFGDAFYYGPERLGSRYENDEQARISSGFNESTYRTILERLDMKSAEVRRFLHVQSPSPLGFPMLDFSQVYLSTDLRRIGER